MNLINLILESFKLYLSKKRVKLQIKMEFLVIVPQAHWVLIFF
jgi:hypothetical protein